MSLIYWIVMIIVLAAASQYIDGLQKNISQDLPNKMDNNFFYKRKSDFFFNKPEREFFILLQEIINGKFIIFSKVRILDLLKVSTDKSHYLKYKNKIQAKHVDFVICDNVWFKPLLALELDGSSHSRADRIERDVFVDEAFNSAGFPIIHFMNSDIGNKDKIYQELKKYLSSSN